MKRLLNTLYVTSGNKYLSLDGENIVVLEEQKEKQATQQTGFCSILGERLPICEMHDKLKGIGSQAKLVSFGKDQTDRNAFYSYGKSLGYNCNISEKAMKQYTAALNFLLADNGHHKNFGDMVVVYFAMKKPKNCIQYGGTTVGPIIQEILSEILPLLNVKKDYSGIEKENTWMDVKTYKVPNFIGLEKSKVKSTHFKFVFNGEGNKVIDQLPKVGEKIEEGKTIWIMLGE